SLGRAGRSARQRRALRVLRNSGALVRRDLSVRDAVRQRRRVVRDRVARGARRGRRTAVVESRRARVRARRRARRLHDVLVVQLGDARARARRRARCRGRERRALRRALSIRRVARVRGRGVAESLSSGVFVCRSHALASKLRGGEVPEWPNGLDSKSSVRAIVPWVRIPPSPPNIQRSCPGVAFTGYTGDIVNTFEANGLAPGS